MATLPFHREYIGFYFIGRERPLEDTVNDDDGIAAYAQRLLEGEPASALALEAATACYEKAKESSTAVSNFTRRRGFRDAVDHCGGDAMKAWEMYHRGAAEALAADLEPEIVECAEGLEEDPEIAEETRNATGRVK